MSDNSSNNRPGTGIIGPVRLVFLNVFKPRINEMKNPPVQEFSCVVLIPKTPNEFCSDPVAVGKAVVRLIKEAAEAKFGQKLPPKWVTPLKDGDAELNNEGEPKFPGYHYLSLSCGVEYPPLLIDCHREKVLSGWQSGDWGMVKASFYGYDHPSGKRGVGGGLRAIQFLKHDEAFGVSAVTTPDEFESRDGDAPLAMQPVDDYDPYAD